MLSMPSMVAVFWEVEGVEQPDSMRSKRPGRMSRDGIFMPRF
jgi:hypothetical protein